MKSLICLVSAIILACNLNANEQPIPTLIQRGPKDGFIRACLVRDGRTNEFASWKGEAWETFYTVKLGDWLTVFRRVGQQDFLPQAATRPMPAKAEDRILLRVGR